MRKLTPIVFAGLVALALTGCGGAANSDQAKYWDDDELVAGQTTNYTHEAFSGDPGGGESTSQSFQGFTGKYVVWRFNSEAGGSVTLDCEAEIEDGKFKLVSISPDGEVDTLFEGSDGCEEELELEAGETRIARIGVDAFGSFTGEFSNLEGATSAEID